MLTCNNFFKLRQHEEDGFQHVCGTIVYPAGSQKCAERKTDDSEQDRSNHDGNILRYPARSPQDGTKSEHYMKKICLILCLIFCGTLARAQCSPFQGLGAAQFFDNNGVVLTNGVLYSFQAGTSTQQATFTDSTCTVSNVNPITFNTGARVNIWLTTGAFYKFQLCLQNDGSTCAPSDVLFSVDQVPGGASGGGGGSGPPFVSGSANPATTGILRCASGDQCLVFRNAANSGNLALSKDSNDVLSWASGAIKLPETGCSNSSPAFDYLCASSTNHRLMQSGNGGANTQIANAGVDINLSDQVTQLHFGATAIPLGSPAPTSGQALLFNGTNVVGQRMESVLGWGLSGFATVLSGAASPCTLAASNSNGGCVLTTFAGAHTILRFTYVYEVQASACGTNAVIGVVDLTSATNLTTVTLTNQALGFHDSGALSIVTTAGDVIGVGLLTTSAGCGVDPRVAMVTMVYQ